MSKILEKNIFEELTKLSDHSYSQCGFRTKSSTSNTIADATNYVTSSLDRKYFTIDIFIDLMKAFDTVDHDILL